MPRNTYRIGSASVAATSANYVLGIVEAGPAKVLRITRVVVWNAGTITTPQTLNLTLTQQTTVGSGATVTPVQRDTTGPAFTGVCRAPGATAGTLGSNYATVVVYVPSTLAKGDDIVVDLTDGGRVTPPTVQPGAVAPIAATGTSNTNWYMVATNGTTTDAQWIAAGAAVNPKTGTVVVGTIFQATGAVASGSGTVTPLVLATSMSAGTTYSIASLGTTATAQWQAAGAPAYVNTGTSFKATGAAAGGTGLVVALGSGAGVALLAANGAAGATGLSFALEFTEE